MNRRRYLRAASVSLVAGLAGCGGGGNGSGSGGGNGGGGGGGGGGGDGGAQDTPSPTPSLEQVEVSAPNVSPDDPDYTLDVTWNSYTVTEVEPDDGEVITPREAKAVVVALDVTGPSDRSVSIDPDVWRLGATGVQYQPIAASTSYFPATTVAGGDTASGWLAFSLPNAVFVAQLIYAQSNSEGTAEVQFTKDEDMSIPPL